MVSMNFAPSSIVYSAATPSTNSRGAFPGLIPGLAGSLPGLTPPRASKISERSSTSSPPTTEHNTHERLERLEALVSRNADDIQSLKRYNSAMRHDNESLRLRLAELEDIAAKSPRAFASPASAIDYLAKRRQQHPGYQSPAPAGKPRPRFLPA